MLGFKHVIVVDSSNFRKQKCIIYIYNYIYIYNRNSHATDI